MKWRSIKLVQAVVAVLFFAGALVPACAGQKNYSMSCCRHQAQPVSSHAEAANAKPCCSQTEGPSSRSVPGCRYVQAHLAFDPGYPALSPGLAATALVIPHDAFELPSSRSTVFFGASSQSKTPIFLRTQTLLI